MGMFVHLAISTNQNRFSSHAFKVDIRVLGLVAGSIKNWNKFDNPRQFVRESFWHFWTLRWRRGDICGGFRRLAMVPVVGWYDDGCVKWSCSMWKTTASLCLPASQTTDREYWFPDKLGDHRTTMYETVLLLIYLYIISDWNLLLKSVVSSHSNNDAISKLVFRYLLSLFIPLFLFLLPRSPGQVGVCVCVSVWLRKLCVISYGRKSRENSRFALA